MSDESYTLSCTLSNDKASLLHEELSKILSTRPSSITIDAHRVEILQTGCLQVILAFIKECRDIDISVSIDNPSNYFVKTSNYLNLVESLGLS